MRDKKTTIVTNLIEVIHVKIFKRDLARDGKRVEVFKGFLKSFSSENFRLRNETRVASEILTIHLRNLNFTLEFRNGSAFLRVLDRSEDFKSLPLLLFDFLPI